MSACEFVGSNVDFYVPLVLKRADLFLAADLFLECLDLYQSKSILFQMMSTPIFSSEKDDHDDKYDKFRSEEETMRTSISTRKLIFYTFLASLVADTYALRLSS